MVKLGKRVSPHTLRPGDRVYQRYSPWNTGIVSKVVKNLNFTVVYDFPKRKRGQPRQRFTYPVDLTENFLIGNPPEVAPPSVNVEES
jgi:hypothetical protein